MEIKTSIGEIAGFKADATLLTVFEGAEKLEGATAALDSLLDGAITGLISQGEITGKLNQVTIVHSYGKIPAKKLAVTGLGKEQDLTLDKIRGAVATACRRLRSKKTGSIAAVAPGIGVAGITPEGSAQAVAEGAVMGTYTFRRHITKASENGEIKLLTIVDAEQSRQAAIKQGSEKGRILADATNIARDMVNEPANYMTPSHMADIAAELPATKGFEVKSLDKEQMQKLGMGAMLGVAQASSQPPKFIIMNYKGKDSEEIDIALLGKAITFDSGGISIKPSEGMGEMKADMAGGAAVIGAMSAIVRLKPEVNVLALVPATENLPGGNAVKPGDVLTSMSGKTIEIISTDAEGRLVLADAVAYARQQKASRIVDVATLTGACRIALGDVCTGAFTNNQELVDKLIAAGTEAGEKIWQMPMYDEYKDQNKSDVADIKNTGGRLAGAITAAAFIGEFAEDTPWVHLDIAGTNMTDKERNHNVKGATGVPVRTLVNLVLSLSDK